MYLPNFLDGFDRLVAFDAETTGKRTPDAEFVRKQPFAWRAAALAFRRAGAGRALCQLRRVDGAKLSLIFEESGTALVMVEGDARCACKTAIPAQASSDWRPVWLAARDRLKAGRL
jgi:hypothetical protein